MTATRIKLSDVEKKVTTAFGIYADYRDEVPGMFDDEVPTKAVEDKFGIRKAFADYGITDDMFISERGEPAELRPEMGESKGLVTPEASVVPPVEEPKKEEKAPEEKKTADEIDSMVEKIKEILKAEDVEKEVKKMGEEMITELEARKQAIMAAQEFISKNMAKMQEAEAKKAEEEAKKEEKVPAVPAA